MASLPVSGHALAKGVDLLVMAIAVVGGLSVFVKVPVIGMGLAALGLFEVLKGLLPKLKGAL